MIAQPTIPEMAQIYMINRTIPIVNRKGRNYGFESSVLVGALQPSSLAIASFITWILRSIS